MLILLAAGPQLNNLIKPRFHFSTLVSRDEKKNPPKVMEKKAGYN